MVELAFLIFAVVGLIATARLWKPLIVEKAEEATIYYHHNKVEQQDVLHDLANKIDDMKAKHNGVWYTIEAIENKMK